MRPRSLPASCLLRTGTPGSDGRHTFSGRLAKYEYSLPELLAGAGQRNGLFPRPTTNDRKLRFPMSAHILPRLTLLGAPLATMLIAPNSVEPVVETVTVAASLITDTYW